MCVCLWGGEGESSHFENHKRQKDSYLVDKTKLTQHTLQVLKTNLVWIQLNQVLNGKKAFWRAISRSAGRELLLKRWLGTHRQQFNEVVLVHKTFIDAHNEVVQRLKLNEDHGSYVERQRVN